MKIYVISAIVIMALVALFIYLESGDEFFTKSEEVEMTESIAGAVFTSFVIIMLMMGVLVYQVEKEVNANERTIVTQ